MTIDGPRERGPEPDVAAAELALGLLDGDERSRALRRQLADPDFAREVERWRDHFAALFASWPDVAPPPQLESRILAATAANDGSALKSARPWKFMTVGSSIVAAALAFVLVTRPPEIREVPVETPATSAMVAAMAPTTGAPMAARYDARSHQLTLGGQMTIPAGRSAQLWSIEGDSAPRPLGLFREVSPGHYVADATTRPIPVGSILAISMEPQGGSPTGAPTGPVIASGTLKEI
ncbi:MAG: anti-sigma factor [Sphingomicrobium sp.]